MKLLMIRILTVVVLFALFFACVSFAQKTKKDSTELSEEVRKRIKNHEVWVGMTEGLLLKSQGKCDDLSIHTDEDGGTMFCSYGSKRLVGYRWYMTHVRMLVILERRVGNTEFVVSSVATYQ